MMKNTGTETMTISRGMRFAQLLFIPVLRVDLQRVTAFSCTTERGEGGFGSTGN
jgi:dUTP pyrophosphatase